jgi:hypothetical protein
MEFGLLFFMECWHPNQKLVVECCFLDFLWLCDEDDLELRTVCQVVQRDKYQTTKKAKHSGFLDFNSSQFSDYCWEFSG